MTINDSTAGSTIHYTTDGTVPTGSSPSYAGAISIAATSTVQAIAVMNGNQSGVASSTLTITGENPTPVRLAFVQQPSNSAAQATISPAITVAVEDVSGNLVPSAADPVTLALVDGSGLAGTLTVTPHNGIATFSDLTVSTPGTGLTLLATSPQMSFAISATFTIGAPGSVPVLSPAKLAFLQQPSSSLLQAIISPAVQVVIEDGNGNAVTTATSPVTVALTGASGLGGTLTVTPQNGIATFSNLTVSIAGSYTLSATSPGLTSATSASFTISPPEGGTAPTPVKLTFVQQPSNASTQTTISPAVQVMIEDANGNAVTTATNPVTVALTGSSALGGTLTVTPHNGIATFSNLAVSAAGTYTLSATSPNLASTTSTSFTISAPSNGAAPTPVKLAFLQQPSNALTQAIVSPAVQVVVEDANGIAVTTASNPVTVALTGASGLGGTLTVTPQNGIATFSNLTVGASGTYTLSATSPTLTSATSTSFTISTPGSGTTPTPVKLAFLQQPSNALTQAAISPAVQVAVEDSSGNTVTTATNPVTSRAYWRHWARRNADRYSAEWCRNLSQPDGKHRRRHIHCRQPARVSHRRPAQASPSVRRALQRTALRFCKAARSHSPRHRVGASRSPITGKQCQ